MASKTVGSTAPDEELVLVKPDELPVEGMPELAIPDEELELLEEELELLEEELEPAPGLVSPELEDELVELGATAPAEELEELDELDAVAPVDELEELDPVVAPLDELDATPAPPEELDAPAPPEELLDDNVGNVASLSELLQPDSATALLVSRIRARFFKVILLNILIFVGLKFLWVTLCCSLVVETYLQ